MNLKFLHRWVPDTGGSNIPALNELLRDFSIELGDSVLEGYFSMLDHRMYYASGANLIQFPQGNDSIIIERELHDQGREVIAGATNDHHRRKRVYPILGLLQTDSSFEKIQTVTPNPPKEAVPLVISDGDARDEQLRVHNRMLLGPINNNEIDDYEPIIGGDREDERENAAMEDLKSDGDVPKIPPTPPHPKSGRIAVYGDSNCLDSTHMDKACFWLLDTILEYTMNSHVTSLLRTMNKSGKIKFDPSEYLLLIVAF